MPGADTNTENGSMGLNMSRKIFSSVTDCPKQNLICLNGHPGLNKPTTIN